MNSTIKIDNKIYNIIDFGDTNKDGGIRLILEKDNDEFITNMYDDGHTSNLIKI